MSIHEQIKDILLEHRGKENQIYIAIIMLLTIGQIHLHNQVEQLEICIMQLHVMK